MSAPVAPQAVQLRRLAGWRKPEGAVSVARPGVWGNWLVPGDRGRIWARHWDAQGSIVTLEATLPFPVTREEAVRTHRAWLAGEDVLGWPDLGPLRAEFVNLLRPLLAEKRAAVLARLPELRGRSLCCWCCLPVGDAPDECHRASLLDLANGGVST